MKYDHVVVAYGKYYAAGEEVPENDMKNVETVEPDPNEEIGSTVQPQRRGRPKKTQ